MSQTTPARQRGIRTEFARRRSRQFLLAIPPILVLIPMAVLERDEELLGITPGILMSLFGVVVVGAVVGTLFNWRCPACGGYLGKAMNPRFCSKCGRRLR